MFTALIILSGICIFTVLTGLILLGVSWLIKGKEADEARLEAMGIYIGEQHD